MVKTKKNPRKTSKQKKSKTGLWQRFYQNKPLLILVCAGLVGLIGGYLLSLSQAASTTKTFTFTAVEDSYANSEGPDTIYDYKEELKVSGGTSCSTTGTKCTTGNRVAYIKFNVTNIPVSNATTITTVNSVKLRMYSTNGGPDGGTVYKANSNQWSESTLTWNNRPSFDTSKVYGTVGNVTDNTWVDVKLVSGTVSTNGTITLAIANKDLNVIWYTNRESSYKPQLIITTTTTDRPVASTASYPGQPKAGKVYWGSSLTENGDPTAVHETPTGEALGVRRTFFQSGGVSSAVATAKSDLAKGRLPMISLKPPGSWKDVGDGKYDSWIDNMLKQLAALNGPVWLVIHHEPEGGPDQNGPDDSGGPAQHVRMNQRVHARMEALGTKNIALALVLMGCTYNSTPTNCPNRNPADWWFDGYDIVGADPYFSVTPVGRKITDTPQVINMRTFAAQKKKDVAFFEWGVNQENQADSALKMKQLYEDMTATPPTGQARIVATSYFDSTLNGGARMTGQVLDTFHTLMKDDRSIHWNE